MTELRTGNHDWATLDQLVAAPQSGETGAGSRRVELMVKALERFRKDRGFYIVSDSQVVAMDHLSPHYLPQVIRVDPGISPTSIRATATTSRSAPPARTAKPIRLTIW